MDTKRSLYNKADIFIIVSILAIAAICYAVYGFLQKSEGTVIAEIVYDGAVVKRLALDKDETFSFPENKNVVFEVHDHAIRFESSDCPDKICVHTGYIKHSGQVAACLPNKFALRIVSNKNDTSDTPDLISY